MVTFITANAKSFRRGTLYLTLTLQSINKRYLHKTLTIFLKVYNLVGVVHSHSDEEALMVEVEFHNTSTHHSFSLPNPSGYSMAALSEQALVLAAEKQDEQAR